MIYTYCHTLSLHDSLQIYRKWKACFSAALYKERNLVERFFNKLKFFRRIATRYDKLGSTFMAMVKLASIRIRSEEHTSELQSLMRISYAVFCLKKNNITHIQN